MIAESIAGPFHRGAPGFGVVAAVFVFAGAACTAEPAARPGGGARAPLERLDPTLASCGDLGLDTGQPLWVDTVASGLEVPWDLAFLPDGRVLVTERGGRIRVIDPESGLHAEPWATLEVAAVAEAGLLGIDVAPDFARTGHVYVVGTYQDVPSGRFRRLVSGALRRALGKVQADGATVWRNRVVRFTDGPAGGGGPEVVVQNLPAGPVHAGGGLRFGPDGHLYLGLGDGGEPESAGQLRSLRGKILRFDPEGRASEGNPWPGSPVFAAGFRNPQAMAWHPLTGELFAVDHGPTGLEREGRRTDQDELNRVIAGGDHGWPVVAGMWSGGGFVTPLAEWTPAVAPAGLAIVADPRSAWHGDVFVTGLRGQRLTRVVMERAGTAASPTRPACTESLLEGTFGRLRAVRAGPDGFLYVGTSNRDQRGRPGADDDLLIRIATPRANGRRHARAPSRPRSARSVVASAA